MFHRRRIKEVTYDNVELWLRTSHTETSLNIKPEYLVNGMRYNIEKGDL